MRRELVTGCAFRRYEQLRDISRDDRARIATFRLRTATDRLKENTRLHGLPYMVVPMTL